MPNSLENLKRDQTALQFFHHGLAASVSAQPLVVIENDSFHIFLILVCVMLMASCRDSTFANVLEKKDGSVHNQSFDGMVWLFNVNPK